MKRQPREVYGFGPRLRTKPVISAKAALIIVIVAMLAGALI